MIEILVLWSIITAIVYLCGYSILKLIFASDHSIDICILTGFMALTVYSQFFSLFYKTGLICFAILLLLSGLLFVLSFLRNRAAYDNSLGKYVKSFISSAFSPLKKQNPVMIIFAIIIILFASVWTSLPQQYYDTWFYHSQAIRWFEEYGVIKGLGNLHCRFAYNSSFMGLQALLSFRFLKYPSFHVVNGLISVVFALYALTTNKLFDLTSIKGKAFTASDFVKLPIFYWIFRNAKYMSSCQTDDLAMLLVIYIVAKWLETSERDSSEDKLKLYCILSVFGVWALTVKLSAATLVVLAIYPAVILIKEKNIKGFIGAVLSGLFVALPWLIRNVIISGWLVYPFPAIDLFDVEWKMPKELAVKDNEFIRDFAVRNWKSDSASATVRIFIVFSIVALIGCIIFLAIQLYKKENLQECLVLSAVLIGLAYWLLSAPAWRFGEPYLMICILYFTYKMIGNPFGKITGLACAAQLLICFGIFTITLFGNDAFGKTFIHQTPYSTPTCRSTTWEGMTIYYPDEDTEIIGYENFPAFNYSEYMWDGTIDQAELMGDSLKDGVKWKN